MSAAPPPPPMPCGAPPPPPPPAFKAPVPTAAQSRTGSSNGNGGNGGRPDNSQLLREIERGVTLKRVPEGQPNQPLQQQSLRPTGPAALDANGNGNSDDIERKKKQVQDELNSTLQRRQKGERLRPHFVLPKNSTINAIYNQLQHLDEEREKNAGDAPIVAEEPLNAYQQQPYLHRFAEPETQEYQERAAAPVATFYGNGNGNGSSTSPPLQAPAVAAHYGGAATLPRASPARQDDRPVGLMISHAKPNFVRPAATATPQFAGRPTPAQSEPDNDLARNPRFVQQFRSAEEASSGGSSAAASRNGSSRNSPVPFASQTLGRSGTSSPFIVKKNVPIVLQQQQQSPAPTPAAIDTRNDEDISNAIRRLRSVESPDRSARDGSPGNLVVFNNVVRPQQQQQQQPPIVPGQWTFVPHVAANGNNDPATSGFRHTVETVLRPPVNASAPAPAPAAAPSKTNWTFEPANGNSDSNFHITVEYPSSNGGQPQLQRPAPAASPIETTLDSLKKTLASVSRSPVSGRKINPNQPALQQQQQTPSPPIVGSNGNGNGGQQDIQRKMQQLRKVDLKQDSSWMNKHNLQSPPQSPPAMMAAQQPQLRQPHVIHHSIQIVDGGGVVAPSAVPSTADVRNIVSFARDLADSPNRYPDTVLVSKPVTAGNGPGDDMIFTNLKFVIDGNGDIVPNTFAPFKNL